MPFRTGGGGGFVGDSNMATFMDEVVETFMTDAKAGGGLGWIQQTASRGKGSTPNFGFMFSRGGIGTEAAPFFMCQTTAKTLYMYSGDDINTAQEEYDQPGNPQNQPNADPFSAPADPTTTFALLRCLALTTVVGSYDDFWVFGGPTGEYCHVVLKVGARQYRHFHVGLFTPLHSDFPADSFYITNHRWTHLGPDNLNSNSSPGPDGALNHEHKPYLSQGHILPFRNNQAGNIGFTGGYSGDVRSVGMWIHTPGGFGTLGHEWWLPTGVDVMPDVADGGTLGRIRASSGNFDTVTTITKSIGDVNETADAVQFGAASVTGYDYSLGAIPFACEPTFTSDGVPFEPIYILLPSDFESALRWAPVAQVPDVFRVNMKSLDAEEEISIAGQPYIVFPMINKDSNNTVDFEGYSGYEGLAYKKITANAT